MVEVVGALDRRGAVGLGARGSCGGSERDSGDGEEGFISPALSSSKLLFKY